MEQLRSNCDRFRAAARNRGHTSQSEWAHEESNPESSARQWHPKTSTSFSPFDAISTREISDKWKRSLLGSAAKVFSKSMYENPSEMLSRIEATREKINGNGGYAKAVLIAIKGALDAGFISQTDYNAVKDRIKVKSVNPDIYVPGDEEVKQTISKLQGDGRTLFLGLLYSGLRATELQYLLNNHARLKAQRADGFVKISLNWRRGRKNALFAYLPADLYAQLQRTKLAVNGLKSVLKVRGLMPLKYTRKVFYTQARSIGAPAEVVDFIQGRAATSVGAVHYLDAQRLADEWYSRICSRIDGVSAQMREVPNE